MLGRLLVHLSLMSRSGAELITPTLSILGMALSAHQLTHERIALELAALRRYAFLAGRERDDQQQE